MSPQRDALSPTLSGMVRCPSAGSWQAVTYPWPGPLLPFLNGILAQIPLSPLSLGFSPLWAGSKAPHAAQPGEV